MTPTKRDLVEELRRLSKRQQGGAKAGERRAALRVAADEIEKIRDRLKAAEAVAETFGVYLDSWYPEPNDRASLMALDAAETAHRAWRAKVDGGGEG